MCGKCCYTLLKGSMCSVNLIVMVIGCLMTAAGVSMLVTEHMYLDSIWYEFSMVSYFMLAAGLTTLVISFLACCGSLISSKCLLTTFALCIFCLIVGEITLGLMVYFQEVDYKSVTHTVIQEVVSKKYHKNNTQTVFYWDVFQKQFECCGYSGPIDWAYSTFNGYQDITKEIGIGSQTTALPFTIPQSCCRNSEDPLCSSTITPKFKTVIDENVYYTQGCVQALFDFVSGKEIYFIIVGSVLFLIELLSIIFATCLCCTIKKIEDFKP